MRTASLEPSRYKEITRESTVEGGRMNPAALIREFKQGLKNSREKLHNPGLYVYRVVQDPEFGD
jgi:hypothetical protein